MADNVELGCGLIAIGRPWGTTPEVPTEKDALQFLETAYELGIRTFDTAPAYGLSEERLGKFLSGLTISQRSGVRVMTKFGEYWDPVTGTGEVDHSMDRSRASIDHSLELLGAISVLQVHKTSEDVLGSDELHAILSYAHGVGIEAVGASVSTVDVADMVIADGRFDYVQMPLNRSSPEFRDPVEDATAIGMKVIVNRPFNMGRTVTGAEVNKQSAAEMAFRYILSTGLTGSVLTGTSNVEHLRQNVEAFDTAVLAFHKT